MSVLYKGFQIFISSYLGSGQPIYQIKGLPIEGRRDYVTSIGRAKDKIDQYLGTYVAPVASSVTQVLSKESFDQLQSGFLAQQELDKLKASVSATTDKLENTLASLQGSYSGLTGVKEGIADASGQVADISAGIAQAREDIVNSISGEFQSLTDRINALTDRIGAGTESLQESKGVIEGATGLFQNAISTYQDTIETYKKMLAEKGQAGFIKMIPYYVGAGLAVIVGVKVLDVMD